jgi:tetratricopeptide (TPR) repeat protein
MRSLSVVVLVASCGGTPARSTLPVERAHAPASDLAVAKDGAAPHAGGDRLVAKDPRIVDLDIIRITATTRGVGGDPELDHVSTAELFKQANDAAKGGETERAIALYRKLVAEFPDSRYAPVALFNVAAIYDGRRDLTATIDTLRELVRAYPGARESIEGHLYIAAILADHARFADTVTTLDEVLVRANLTYADRIEANARRGYALVELKRYQDAEAALFTAMADWKRAPRIEDTYYIAMAHYYAGELSHRKFADAPVRLPDAQLVADLEAKRILAVRAYDAWKESLRFKQAYWATASGYQMSQIFVELWEAHVKAPYPARVDVAARKAYVEEVHGNVKEHLAKALEGHRMNVELAKAYGVETDWSRGSAQRAVEVMELLAREGAGQYVMP